MMANHLKAAALALLLLLAACGGNSDSTSGSVTSANQLPTWYTSEGRPMNTCGLNPVCSGNPLAPFFASVSMAPAEGAALSGMVRLEVSGNDMANVELLPSTGYQPRLGVFNRSADGTRAWLDLDTTRLPNGPVALRISAFNAAAGQAGAAEIVAMPARTWVISNTAPPPAAFSAALTAAPADGAVVSGVTRLEVRGAGIVHVELLPATGLTPKLASFNVSADKTFAWLDFDSRALPDGVQDVRISAFSAAEGQPDATEIVAMPARHWEFRNKFPFTASVTLAPLHGELVSGTTRLEVRGSALRNVELLPANGYAPQLGIFNISADRRFAWLDFDTSTLPNGLLEARISAFNVPAGQPGALEIVAMPTRQWALRH